MVNKVTENMFSAVKLMIAGGAKEAEVCKYMGIGKATYYRIKSAETFAEYKSIVTAIAISNKEKNEKSKNAPKAEENPPAVVHQSVTVQATHYMMEKLDKIIELLTVMNNKIGFVVDELTGIPGDKKDD